MHNYYGLNELRELFLSFFESKGHLRLPSFSLIPQNDPSLLLINSGMAPMKPFFTGEQEPPSRRVTTCQKCIRTGDIENIGHTDRHGTYFEMLGNFSFGDYFKSESLAWSWEFLTKTVGLEEERLYPSIYVEDDEAFDIWTREIGVPAGRITRLGKGDNFWEHGAGPCGPCSEIYYDRGEEHGCGSPDCGVGCDCDRFIEVWNNVFSQFNNDGEGNYTELSQKNIDTGMGLERLACVVQNVNSLFDVDTVMNITNEVSRITSATYGQSKKTDVSLRVITDHIRSATMMICDGVLPSNEGRGYVLRRLLRRAARHGKLLGVNDPFLFQVCGIVVSENASAYPDLVEKESYITRVIRVEEENFSKTIDSGMKILDQLMSEHQNKGQTVFSGSDAFRLYDTYGFPIDLTIEILEEAGMTVDRDGFDQLMQAQRVRAREARAALGDLAWAGVDLGLDNTPTEFSGYECEEDQSIILALVESGEVCSVLSEGQEGIVVLDRTPFYAEMGGQVADQGVLTRGENTFLVRDVQKTKGGKYLHHGVMQSGTLSVDDEVTATLDHNRRQAIRRAHSATHLVQKALRELVGDHVHQAGSLVEPDRLRFDFTHFESLTPEQLAGIDHRVNTVVMNGYPVDTQEMGIDEAKARGAMALFGEKYGSTVRVVDMGGYSVELCGGTHLDNTAKVGPFRIQSEFSVASGVRRIEAVVGEAAMNQINENQKILFALAAKLKTSPGELNHRLEQHIQESRELHRMVESFQAKQALGQADQFLFGAKNVGDLKVITATVGEAEPDTLRQIGDVLRDKDDTVVAVLSSVREDKITFVAVCGKQAIKAGVKAGDLIKSVTKICGGSGGGKPDSAMGGGRDIMLLDNALASVDQFVSDILAR
ncbi:MAG: alaS [Oscillospiraceae bacterium]|nr:alaS [Oscillospiraceae bacterium]